MSQREPAPGAAKSRDHLVSDEQHIVPIADLPQSWEIRRWRHDHATGAHHRFGNYRRDRVSALRLDCRLDRISGLDAGIAVAGPAIRIGRGHLEEVWNQRAEHLLIAREAGSTHRRQGDAVVAVLA